MGWGEAGGGGRRGEGGERRGCLRSRSRARPVRSSLASPEREASGGPERTPVLAADCSRTRQHLRLTRFSSSQIRTHRAREKSQRLLF